MIKPNEESEKNQNLKHDIEILHIRNNFLEEKIYDLRNENFSLHAQIASLKDDLKAFHFNNKDNNIFILDKCKDYKPFERKSFPND